MLIDEARLILAEVRACATGEKPVVDRTIPEEEVWMRLSAAAEACICTSEIEALLEKRRKLRK